MIGFDEQNIIGDKNSGKERKQKSIPYEEYFGEMDLPEEEKKKRIELARKIELVILFYFMMRSDNGIEAIGIDYYEELIYQKIILIANEYMGASNTSSYIDDYARQISKDIVRATEENQDDDYYTSNDRAVFVAENEANSIGNYKQQSDAVKDGKKYKTWISQRDNKVRHTHSAVDGKRIGIFEEFLVGESSMMFPKDTSLGASAEEIVNCRCVVHYSK